MENIMKKYDFSKRHNEQFQNRKHNDVFFIWMVIMFISVLAAHMILGITTGSPTGMVVAGNDLSTNGPFILGAMMLSFFVIAITALIHIGITQKDH